MTDNTYKRDKDFLKSAYNVKSVARGTQYWAKYLLSRCQNILLFENLPDTVPAWELLKSLIIKGNATFVKKNGKYYVPFTGNVFGYDAYYVPNKFTYAQPVIGSGSGLEDGKNCAIVWCTEVDKSGGSEGLLWQTIKRFSRMLADLESSYENMLISSRGGIVGQAANATAAQALDAMLAKLENGDMSSILNKTLPLDSIKFEQFAPVTSFSWFCEARDYLINAFLNQIGLQTLEEKKERMITGEISADADVLSNNIDIMYKSVSEGIEKVNKTFGLDIKVYKNAITNPIPVEDEIISTEDTEEEVEEV